MIVITSENNAIKLAEIGIRAEHHINGHLKGETVSVLADSTAHMDALVNELKAAQVRLVLPLPTGLAVDDVPGRLTALEQVARVKHSDDTPSMSLLNAALASVIRQPTPFWQGPVEDQAAAFAEFTATSREFTDISLITCASALVIGRIALQVRPGWIERPILHTALVGDSGTGKSPLLNAVTAALYARQVEAMTDTDTINTTSSYRDRWVISNATIEAAAVVLHDAGRGVLKVADELSDHFASMTRYTKSTYRGQWLSAWNGAPEIIDRKGNAKPLPVPHFGISVLGGIQPVRLADVFDGVSDGLGERLLTLYPDPPPVVKNGPETASTATWERVIDHLLALRAEDRTEQAIPLTKRARDHFEEWRFNMLSSLRKKCIAIDGRRAKRPAHVARIALIITLVEQAAEGRTPPSVDVQAIKRAIEYQKLLDSHRRRAMLETGGNNLERIAVDLARFIVESRAESLDTYELKMGRQVAGVRDERMLRAVLSELHSARWIKTPIPRGKFDALPRVVMINEGVHVHAEG